MWIPCDRERFEDNMYIHNNTGVPAMPKSSNQKLKLIYLAKLMQEKTDDEHGLTMPEIIHELDLCGIKAERKSIYDDFEALSTI